MIAVGCDPGHDNGAVAVVDTDARRVLACWAWTTPAHTTKANPDRTATLQRWTGSAVTSEPIVHGPGMLWVVSREVVAYLHSIGRLPGVLAVEGIIPHHRGPVTASIAAGEAAGAACQALGAALGMGVPLERPKASVWRALVGVTTTDARRAAMDARALVGDETSSARWPTRLHGLPAELARIDHAADACLIGEAGALVVGRARGVA